MLLLTLHESQLGHQIQDVEVRPKRRELPIGGMQRANKVDPQAATRRRNGAGWMMERPFLRAAEGALAHGPVANTNRVATVNPVVRASCSPEREIVPHPFGTTKIDASRRDDANIWVG